MNSRRKDANGLTLKQEKFAQCYAVTGNACEAYRRAYDAENMGRATIEVKACELLKHGKVAVRVKALMAKADQIAEERYAVTADRIIRELALIAFARVDEYYSWGPDGVEIKDSASLTSDQLAAIAEVTTVGGAPKPKLSDKQAALEKLARIKGVYIDRSVVDQTVTWVVSAEPRDDYEPYGSAEDWAAEHGNWNGDK